jgi:hypothetical protein
LYSSPSVISVIKSRGMILTEHVARMVNRIWGFHGGDYEECCLLGCYAVWLL